MVTIGRLRPGRCSASGEGERNTWRASGLCRGLFEPHGWLATFPSATPPRQRIFTQKGDNRVQASPFTFLRRRLAPPVTDAPRMARTCDAPTQSPSPFQTHDATPPYPPRLTFFFCVREARQDAAVCKKGVPASSLTVREKRSTKPLGLRARIGACRRRDVCRRLETQDRDVCETEFRARSETTM